MLLCVSHVSSLHLGFFARRFFLRQTHHRECARDVRRREEEKKIHFDDVAISSSTTICVNKKKIFFLVRIIEVERRFHFTRVRVQARIDLQDSTNTPRRDSRRAHVFVHCQSAETRFSLSTAQLELITNFIKTFHILFLKLDVCSAAAAA